MEKLSRAVTVLVVVAAVVVVAGCDPFVGKPAPATPVHTVNVFFDGLTNHDFREVCSVVKGFPTAAQCEQYFTVNAAISGGGLTGHAIPHSEKIHRTYDDACQEAKRPGYAKPCYVYTATVKGVDSNGTRYVATLARQKDGGWKLTSVSAA